jgi:simple sugar transport system permease protein
MGMPSFFCINFSDGLYQFLFLFVLGGIIVINHPLMISTGVGVVNTINLRDSLRGSLDEVSMLSILTVAFFVVTAVTIALIIFRKAKGIDLRLKNLLAVFVPVAVAFGASFIPVVRSFLSAPRLTLLYGVNIAVISIAIWAVYRMVSEKFIQKKDGIPMKAVYGLVGAAVLFGMTFVPLFRSAFRAVNLPVLTFLCIGALCLFLQWLMNTKLGQDMRTVGQDRAVAASSGINVDRTRILAMIISTVLASYGQLISLQNMGTVATYGSHQQVGLYGIAALLVGGASVQQAKVKHALLGVVLFHTLFILAPNAGQALLGDAQIGEYFRAFVAFGVIALALAMHAWGRRKRA